MMCNERSPRVVTGYRLPMVGSSTAGPNDEHHQTGSPLFTRATTEATRMQRTTTADLEVRSDGRTIAGICVPFDSPARIAENGIRFWESFKRGAFTKSINERGSKVKLLAAHDSQNLPIGRATLLREDAKGLYGEFKVSATRAGDEVLALVQDGALDSFSIGFRPIRDKWTPDRTRCDRLEVALSEVSVVTFPAYPGASIDGVRSLSSSLALRRLDLLEQRFR
jgi:uncharacterized protein